MTARAALLLFLFATVLLSGCVSINDAKNKMLEIGVGVKEGITNLKESTLSYWACMDGCYFMQKIHEEKYGINVTKEDHHIRDLLGKVRWWRG